MEGEIIKASGEKQVFSKGKFCNSLKKTGAPADLVEEVCNKVEGEVKPGATTSYIFRLATRYLMESNLAAAARYNLKRGIGDLGPAGFLFEKFVEVMLKELEYETSRNQIMKGKCVSHEVDVLAKKDADHFLVEAKYHNKPGIKTHIDVVMYADARLTDIGSYQEEHEETKANHHMWLITNTKFTHKAITYAECRNMRMTGWNYPPENGLEDLVSKYVLYPVTVLPSVNRYARERFAEYDMMLVRDLALYSAQDLIKKFNIHADYARKIIREAHALIYGE